MSDVLQPLLQHLLDQNQTDTFIRLMMASKQSYQIGHELLLCALRPLEHVPIMVTQLFQESDFIYGRTISNLFKLSDLRQFLIMHVDGTCEITLPIMEHNLFDYRHRIKLDRSPDEVIFYSYECKASGEAHEVVDLREGIDYLRLLLDLGRIYRNLRALNCRFLLI
jgi:hypothetical protein